jgi:hypothetical protein
MARMALVLESTMKQVVVAERADEKRPARSSGSACPAFFRAQCETAKAGGSSGYRWAGFGLAGAVSCLGPWGLGHDEWVQRVSQLAGLLDSNGDDADVIAWFQTNLPRCIALVPKRRLRSFVDGVRRFVEERGSESL